MEDSFKKIQTKNEITPSSLQEIESNLESIIEKIGDDKDFSKMIEVVRSILDELKGEPNKQDLLFLSDEYVKSKWATGTTLGENKKQLFFELDGLYNKLYKTIRTF